jgi:hypothetical protein
MGSGSKPIITKKKRHLRWCTGDAMANHYKHGGLKQHKLIFSQIGDQKFKGSFSLWQLQ